MKNRELVELLLPEEIVKYFDVVKVEKTTEQYTIYLEEKNDTSHFSYKGKLLSKGFCEPVTIQDFPVRGKACYLNIKRRRWTVESTGEIVNNEIKISAKGTRITKEFANFLKGTHR